MEALSSVFMVYGKPSPLQPLRGYTPKEVPLLRELPKEVTLKHLQAAERVLRMGSVPYLVMAQQLNYRHWEASQRKYVELAVYEQWRHFAPEKLLEVLRKQAQLVSRTQRNRLYRWEFSYVDAYFRGPTTFIFDYLVYTCPSTHKLYISGVPRGLKGDRAADRAMGWKFGLTLEEYDRLKVEA